MDQDVTSRIAITDLDFDEVTLPTLFKIFESEVEGRINRISLYSRSNHELYAICEFKTKKDSKHIYDTLDGMQIEKTNYTLNLSFIPDVFDPSGSAISECTDSKNFKIIGDTSTKEEFDENLIEMDEDCKLEIEIPEEYRSKPDSVGESKKEKVKMKEEESSKDNILEALKNKDEKEEADIDFQFDFEDKRFQDLYNNEDFILDASNKKFKVQKSSKAIIEKKFSDHTEDK
jgi:hypothetical protein